MQKLKLTKAQLEAINKALDHYNGDADYLLVCHFNLKADGCKWKLWPELNDLNTSQLRAVLRGTYQVVDEIEQPVITDIGDAYVKQFTELIDDNANRKMALTLDLDYWLASLHDAMQRNDLMEMDKCKQWLKEIHGELEVLN